jgi:phosphate transport system substrate-binding protein
MDRHDIASGRKSVRGLGAFGLCAGIALLAGCVGEAEQAGSDAITVVGSSTVYPFAQKVAEGFVAANKGMAQPLIQSTGTGEGIAEFCKGQGPETTDIVNASRRMTVEEFNRCVGNGVKDIIEIKVGRDGIAFVVSADEGINLALTPQIVYRALAISPYGKEQTAVNWSDVDGSLPADAILVYGPPASSGTRDALLDLVIEVGCRADPKMAALKDIDPDAFARNCHALRSDAAYIAQGEQDDLIARKVAGNPRAIGVFGYSYLEENSTTVKGLPINGILPTAETIADGSYPASRPLYIYVKKAHLGVTPGLDNYLVQWAKSWGAGGPLAAIGLIPATEDVQAKSTAAVRDKTSLTAADLAQ